MFYHRSLMSLFLFSPNSALAGRSHEVKLVADLGRRVCTRYTPYPTPNAALPPSSNASLPDRTSADTSFNIHSSQVYSTAGFPPICPALPPARRLSDSEFSLQPSSARRPKYTSRNYPTRPSVPHTSDLGMHRIPPSSRFLPAQPSLLDLVNTTRDPDSGFSRSHDRKNEWMDGRCPLGCPGMHMVPGPITHRHPALPSIRIGWEQWQKWIRNLDPDCSGATRGYESPGPEPSI